LAAHTARDLQCLVEVLVGFVEPSRLAQGDGNLRGDRTEGGIVFVRQLPVGTHSSVAKRLGLPLSPTARVQLQGATGIDTVPYVTAEQLEVGDLLFNRAKLLIVPSVFGGADGVLGVQGLPDMRIHIDFRRDLTEIAYARDQEQPLGERIEFSGALGRQALLDLQVGGVRTKAVIDTGSQQTIGNARLRKALLLRWRRTQDADIVGVTMDITPAKSIRIPSITFGSVPVRNVDISFGELPIFEHWRLNGEPALLLGMDVIDRLEIFEIDYKERKLHLRARGRGPHPLSSACVQAATSTTWRASRRGC
jgi:aspartyl protease